MAGSQLVFLAGASAIGKTTSSRDWLRLPALADKVELLENDTCMGVILDRYCLSEFRRRLNRWEEWTERINQITDCDELIRSEHVQWFRSHLAKPIILAEGYLYMFRRFRLLALSAIAQARRQFDGVYLIHYFPPWEEQIRRYLSRQHKAGRLQDKTPEQKRQHAESHLEQHHLFEPAGDEEGGSFLGKQDDYWIQEYLMKLAGDLPCTTDKSP